MACCQRCLLAGNKFPCLPVGPNPYVYPTHFVWVVRWDQCLLSLFTIGDDTTLGCKSLETKESAVYFYLVGNKGG